MPYGCPYFVQQTSIRVFAIAKNFYCHKKTSFRAKVLNSQVLGRKMSSESSTKSSLGVLRTMVIAVKFHGRNNFGKWVHEVIKMSSKERWAFH